MRTIVCKILKKAPDRNNWSEPNVNDEVIQLLNNAQWYYTYDVIEAVYKKLRLKDQEKYESNINDYFLMNGIRWKFVNGIIEFRGDENFELELSTAIDTLEKAKQNTAKTEIKEAIMDLSRRPEPDITGAVQHSVACLECVAREVAGNTKMTLGELIKKHSSIFPKPLDEAVSRIWGYTSEQGRHLRKVENLVMRRLNLSWGFPQLYLPTWEKNFNLQNKIMIGFKTTAYTGGKVYRAFSF